MYQAADLRGFFPRERFRREFRNIPLRAAVQELQSEASSGTLPESPTEEALVTGGGIHCPFAPNSLVQTICPYHTVCEGECMLPGKES